MIDGELIALAALRFLFHRNTGKCPPLPSSQPHVLMCYDLGLGSHRACCPCAQQLLHSAGAILGFVHVGGLSEVEGIRVAR